MTLAALFRCEQACIGVVLPVEGVRASSTDVATGGVTELQATTITPSLRLGYVALPFESVPLGVAGYFDLGYVVGVGGNVTVRGLAIGISGDVEYWLPAGVAFSAGLGLSGSPYSVLHYPTARVGVAYGF